MKACRIVVNTLLPGGIGDLYNFGMKPSLYPVGLAGSWGGNSVSENVGVKHLLNVKTVAERRENMLGSGLRRRSTSRRGSTPVALDELGTVIAARSAPSSLLTSSFKNGNTRAIEAKLDEMGIAHDCFYDVEPGPRCSARAAAAAQMVLFGLTSSSRSRGDPLWTLVTGCG